MSPKINEELETIDEQANKAKYGKATKRRALSLALLVCAIVVIGSTIAFLSALTSKETNPFSFGEIEITVSEPPNVNWETKKVTLVAGGDIPSVARAIIIPIFKNTEESVDPTMGSGGALTAPVGNKVVMGDITFVLASDWSDNWFYKDGYFYYKTVLQPGDQTAELLNKVSLTTDDDATREKYASIQIEVEVMAESLQAEGGAPLSVWGVNVVGSAVSPA